MRKLRYAAFAVLAAGALAGVDDGIRHQAGKG